MNLYKFLTILFCALAVGKDVDIIYKTCCARTKSEALIAFKKVCVIEQVEYW